MLAIKAYCSASPSGKGYSNLIFATFKTCITCVTARAALLETTQHNLTVFNPCVHPVKRIRFPLDGGDPTPRLFNSL